MILHKAYILLCNAEVVPGILERLLPQPGESHPAAQSFLGSEDCELMLRHGFRDRGAVKSRQPTRSSKAAARSMSVELAMATVALNMDRWRDNWTWRDQPEFTPDRNGVQGWMWVLARLNVLPIEERGPWLRTLSWQDRVLGCLEQVWEVGNANWYSRTRVVCVHVHTHRQREKGKRERKKQTQRGRGRERGRERERDMQRSIPRGQLGTMERWWVAGINTHRY